MIVRRLEVDVRSGIDVLAHGYIPESLVESDLQLREAYRRRRRLREQQELWADGTSLPYVLYDRLSEIDQGAVVENKQLGHVLEIAQRVQAQRDNRRIQAAPSRTLTGQRPRQQREPATPGTKPQRQLNAEDLRRAIDELAQPPHPVDTLPPQASSTALRKRPGKRPKRIKTILH